MRDAFELALDHLGRKMGGLNVETIYEDDGLKPDVGKQKTEKLIQSDKVNFLTGYIMFGRPAGIAEIGGGCGDLPHQRQCRPSQIAGDLCSPWFFSTSWQGDQVPQAIGEYMNQKGVKTAYLLAPELRRRQGRDRRPQSQLQGAGCRRGLHAMAGPARLLDRAVQGALPPSPTRSLRSIPVPPACSS